jgi:hypothetical protein
VLDERFEWYSQGVEELSSGSREYRAERSEERNRLLHYLGWDRR